MPERETEREAALTTDQSHNGPIRGCRTFPTAPGTYARWDEVAEFAIGTALFSRHICRASK